jgi:hypothetical protein
MPTTTPSSQPSTSPTTMPTSMPSCTLGESIDGLCTCSLGWYFSTNATCEICPIGYYSNELGTKECKLCSYPLQNIKKGQDICNGVCLDLEKNGISFAIVGSVSLVYIFCFYLAGEDRISIMLNMLLPMMDHLSDIYYVSKMYFHNYTLFAASLFVLIAPGLLFLLELFYLGDKSSKISLFPFFFKKHLYWLGHDEGMPLVFNVKVPYMFYENDSPLKLMWYLLVWSVLIIGQILSLIPQVILNILYFMFLCCWFMVGMTLFQTRALSVVRVRNFWYFIWCYQNSSVEEKKDDIIKTDIKFEVDPRVLNQCLFCTFMLESCPFLVIQSINNSLNERWTLFEYVSIITSGYMIFCGLYKFVYWWGWRGVKLSQVPLSNPLGFFGKDIEWLQISSFTKPERDVEINNFSFSETNMNPMGRFSTCEIEKV